jgi:hypothetical protein
VAKAVRRGDAAELNAAVCAAYDWTANATDEDLLKRLGDLNRARAG